MCKDSFISPAAYIFDKETSLSSEPCGLERKVPQICFPVGRSDAVLPSPSFPNEEDSIYLLSEDIEDLLAVVPNLEGVNDLDFGR